MSRIIIESRENYRKYLADLAQYCPTLSEYKIYSTDRDYKNNAQKQGIDTLIIIVSHPYMVEKTKAMIEKLTDYKISRTIAILDSPMNTNGSAMVQSQALSDYMYHDAPILDKKTLKGYLAEEGKKLSEIINSI